MSPWLCKSTDVADNVRSLSCKPVKGSVALVPARKQKPTPAKQLAESSGSFLAMTEPPESQSPWPRFLPMTELPEEDQSARRVVEIIFAKGWTGHAAPEVEAIFEVHATPRAKAAYEEARAAARARGEAADPRCAVDGNEMRRFQCRAAGYEVFASLATCRFGPGVDSAVRTFAGSGEAHSSVGGSLSGRRAMLVCLVIAGRVRRADNEPGDQYDSVETDDGELVVTDSRAVLPRFLVVYRVKPALA